MSFAVCLVAASSAWSQSEHTTKLIEGAKKEGTLVWYATMAVSESKPLLDAFEKKYPFVKTELFRGSAEGVVNRIRTETQGGRWEYDLVNMNGTLINALAQRKLVTPYSSPEGNAYSQELKSPEGYWTGVYNLYFVIGYNTKQVSEAEAPKRWEDLLHPRWKGKISIDREEYEWYTTLAAAWGRESARKYMRELANQQIQWRKGHTLIAQLTAAGEFPVAIVYAHRIEEMKKRGAPVEWVSTLDPIVVAVSGIGLSSKPNNPNASKLFIDLVLSKEGQGIMRFLNRIPARSDVESLSPKFDQKKLKLKAIPRDTETRYTEDAREFRRIFDL